MAGMTELTNAFAADLGTPAPVSRAPSRNDGQVEKVGGDVDDSEIAGGDDDAFEGEVDEENEHESDESGTPEQDEADDAEREGDEAEEETPDEGDEDDGAEEDEDERSAEGSDELLNKKVDVTIDGQPAKVTIKEALEGYIRTETFHKRLNEVNDLKKNVESEAAQVSQARNVYGNMLTALQEQLESLTPEEPDWDKAYAEDPVNAARLDRQWRTYKEQRAQIQAEQERVKEENRKEHLQSLAKYAETERQQMLTRHPEWKDQKNWSRDRASMDRTAKAVGFTDQEINSIFDSRQMEILLKASKYDRMMANKPKPAQQNGPKTLRPGTGASRTAPKGTVKASSRLAKTGSLRDASAVFANILKNE